MTRCQVWSIGLNPTLFLRLFAEKHFGALRLSNGWTPERRAAVSECGLVDSQCVGFRDFSWIVYQ
jgi:hypothetical protein